ncbi:MAG: flagellar assembly protein FliW [Eubacteriales bacterium]
MKTKYFGDIDVNEEEIITFEPGIFGFEEDRRFVLLSFLDDEGESSEDFVLCLQSVSEPYLAFILMNPYYIEPTYDPYSGIPESELLDMGLTETTKHTVFCIAVIKDKFEESTVNMKCPLIINMENKKARQFILEGSGYSMREPVSKR